MNYCNIVYSTNSGNLVNEKMKRIKEFTKFITNIEDSNCKTYTDNEINTLNKIINSCKDSGDYISLILHIPVRKDEYFERYLYTFYILVYLFIKSNKDISENNFNNIKNHLTMFENIIKSDKELLDNTLIDEIISNVGHYVNTIERSINNITTDYVYYVSPKTLHSVTCMTESVIMDVDSIESKIISSSDPDGSKTGVCISIGDNPSDFIQDIFNENDHDYFIHKIGRLYDYLLSLQGNFDDIHTKAFIESVNYIISKIINDITAKEILIATLSKCDMLLSNIIPNSDESLNNINIMVNKIEEITNVIQEYPQGEVSLLDEMGLGYIYDCIPKIIDNNTDIENMVSRLNECANNNDILVTLSESIEILNEGLMDNIKRRKKEKEFKNRVKDEKYRLHDDTYDTRVDISRRRQNDEYDHSRNMEQRKDNDKYDFKQQKKQDKYDFKQQKKQDKYSDNREMNNIKVHDKYNDEHDFKEQKKQDNYDFKQQKKQDKYNFKQQKKLDKYEQKKSYAEEKRRAKLEARQHRRDETKIGLNRWKTLELTNANARKAANALRKVVKAGAAAGIGALAGFNPIFAGATYLIGSYLKDKSNPREERRKIVDEMQLQLTEIDEKIDQADRKGENDKKLALMKMRKKIETAYNRTGHLHKMELEM